jgi:hypothetical protein
MLKEGRPGLTEEQKVDMWRRWKAGYSIREICLALKRNSSPLHQVPHSGILPARANLRHGRKSQRATRPTGVQIPVGNH